MIYTKQIKLVFRLLLLAIICIAFLFPVWLMIMNSFTPAMGFLRMPPRLLPYTFTLKNYEIALSLRYMSRWILNTIIVMGVTIVGGVLINGAAGYVFAFAKFRFLKVLFVALIIPIFVSSYTTIIAKFIIVGKLGMPGLMAVLSMSIFWPTGIYLFRNYFRSMPVSLVESARLDGAWEWTILMRVVLPVCKPILGASIVFLGMGALGSYIWQMLNLQAIETRTFIVGLILSAIDVYAVKNIGYEMAVGTLLFLPYLLIFSFSSRYFLEGLTGGALKE